MLADFLAVIGLSWGLDQKRSGTERTLTDVTDHGINQRKTWWQISQDPVIQYFVPPVPLREENYEAKEEERSQYTLNGSNENIELLLRTVDFCESAQYLRTSSRFMQRRNQDFRAPGKLAALDRLEKMKIPTALSIAENSTSAQQLRNLLQEYERTFEQVSEDWKLSKRCSDAGLKLVEQGQILLYSWNRRRTTDATFCRKDMMPRNEKGDSCERMDSPRIQGSSQSWTSKFAIVMIDTASKFKYHLCFKTIPFLGLESWMMLINTWQNRCWPRKEEDIASGKNQCKSKTKTEAHSGRWLQLLFPVPERKWIDIETQRSHDHQRYEVSKAITRLLRHDQSVLRGSDGAIHNNDIIEECRMKELERLNWIPQ